MRDEASSVAVHRSSMPVNACPACDGTSLVPFLDLGIVVEVPLRVVFCEMCGLVFLGETLPPPVRAQSPDRARSGRVGRPGHNLGDYLNTLQSDLGSDGVARIEIPNLVGLYENLEFERFCLDQIYYFSLTSLQALLSRFGLEIIDFCPVGITIRVMRPHDAERNGYSAYVARKQVGRSVSPRVGTALAEEERWQLNQLNAWQAFARRAAQAKDDLLWFIDDEVLRSGRLLVGYGVSSHANTLLAYTGVGAERLAYVVDQSGRSQNGERRIPARREARPASFLRGIPIRSPAQLLVDCPDITLVLDRACAEAAVSREIDYQRRGGRFALPIPEPRLYGLHGLAA